MALIDLKIALSMIDYCKGDNCMQEKKDEPQISAYVFFPVSKVSYTQRLNGLSASQCLERLRVFYNIWSRCN
jgi:hypothetical protein